jgi:hypothetical protein
VTRSTAWYTAHIHYYEPDRSGLLLDGVRPLLDEVADDVVAVYVVPHWLRGPHLRLTVRTHENTWADRVRPAIGRVVGGYLADHPSAARPDERAMAPQHRRLAELEIEPGPLHPWFPDNSIRYPAVVSRAAAMGGTQIEELVTEFYVRSNGLYLDTVCHLRDSTEPVDLVGLSLMFATAEAVGGLPRNVGSFRAHAEGFICALTSDPESVRAVFQRQYEQHHDAIVDLMLAVADTLAGTAATPVPLVTEWSALMTRMVELAEPAVHSGVLRFPDALREADIDNPRFPEYLRAALRNESYVRRGLDNPDFLRYRVVLNCTYLQLTRLGISPRVRHLLCHLAANAIEEHYSVSAIDFITKFVAEHP